MKRMLTYCFLAIIIAGTYISTVGSTYTVISEESPFGIVAVWGWDSVFIPDYNDQHAWHRFCYCPASILPKLRFAYSRKVNAMLDCGLSWNRPNTIPSGNKLQSGNGEIIEHRLNQIDSFVAIMNDNNIYYMLLVSPNKPTTSQMPDDSVYYHFFRALAERYDGDGIGYIMPCGYYQSQYIPEARLSDGTPLILKYWEIVNEPSYNSKWWPGVDGLKTIEAFQKYIRACSNGIHDANPDAKVLGPCIEPLNFYWRNLDNIPDTLMFYTEPDTFWSLMLFDSTDTTQGIISQMDYFDILTFHVGERSGPHSGSVYPRAQKDFIQIDSMLKIWDDLGCNHLRSKDIWITEGGWDSTYFSYVDSIPVFYKLYCESLLQNRDIVQRKFFFCLADWTWKYNNSNPSLTTFFDNPHNILHREDTSSHPNAPLIPFPAYDTLKSFISRNTPYVHLIQPENGTYYSGNSYSVMFDSAHDYYDSNNTVYTTSNSLLTAEVQFSSNNGRTWSLIADNIEVKGKGEGSYIWTFPYLSSDQCKIRVRVKDQHNLIGTSTGDSCFTIKTCSWPVTFEDYPLDWNKSYNIGTYDECDYILELDSNNYLISIKINQDSTGLLLYNSEADSFCLKKVFPKNQFNWIHCILKNTINNYFVLVGKYAGPLNSIKQVFKILDHNFNVVYSTNPNIGEFYDIIQSTEDSTYIVCGWDVVSGVDRARIKKLSVIYSEEEEPSIIWDTSFASSFNASNINGRLYSVIRSSDDNYLAVGHRANGNGGACFYKFNKYGILLDSGTYSYQAGKWNCFYDVAEDNVNGGYVMVGQCQDYEGGIAARIDTSCNTEWFQRYYNDDLISNRLYSVVISNSGDIFVAGHGQDPLLEENTGLVLLIDPDDGELLDITAPLSGLYTDSINISEARPMYKTAAGGYITGCYVAGPSIKKIAIAKFGFEGDTTRFIASANPSILQMNYSVLLANSLFRDHSTIRFILPRQSHVKINVYNILGQRVRTLADDERQPGAYEVIWDGRDNHGTQVSSGSYFLRFEAGEFKTTKSLTVIR